MGCKSKPWSRSKADRKTFRQTVYEVMVDRHTPCEDDTFYVDDVETEKCVDCVESQVSRTKDLSQYTKMTSPMKVNTGAKCNVMSQETFKQVPNFVFYGGSRLKTSGRVPMSYFLKEQCHSLPFFIVDKDL